MMEKTGLRLIVELQKNSRRSNIELAKTLGINEATVRRHIKNLVSSGTIVLTAYLDPTKVGYNTQAFIGLQVELPKIEHVAKQLADFPQVPYIGICAGSNDILFTVRCNSIEDLWNFIHNDLSKISGITKIEAMIQVRSLKRQVGLEII